MKDAIVSVLADFFFEYETPRQVLVRSKRVGIVCRLIQLGVLGYIIGWVFIYEKGYQIEDTAISSVLTKMKGVGYTVVGEQERVWDVADYVFPEQGDASFVVMTNYIITEGQKQGKCPELQDSSNRCRSDSDCEEGRYKRTGNGTTQQSYKNTYSLPQLTHNLHSLAVGTMNAQGSYWQNKQTPLNRRLSPKCY